MVATHALARGIDDVHIQEIEILGAPPTFEDWVQMVGRLRRGGVVNTMWDPNDFAMWLQNRLECDANPTMVDNAKAFMSFLESPTCRHVHLFGLLSEEGSAPPPPCGLCDMCKRGATTTSAYHVECGLLFHVIKANGHQVGLNKAHLTACLPQVQHSCHMQMRASWIGDTINH